MAPPIKLTVAILECDTLLPLSHSRHDNYFGLYKKLLTRGAQYAGLDRDIEWQWKRYDVVRGELPAEEEWRGWEGVVVSGAKYSAYDDTPWIKNLVSFLQKVLNQPEPMRCRVIGICFGHQIVGRALGATVAKSDKGWEISITKLSLNEKGKKVFGVEELQLNQMHKDLVLAHPHSVTPLSFSPICAVQDMYIPGKLFTVEAHPEFPVDVMEEILTKRYEMGVFEKSVYEDGWRRREERNDGVVVGAALVRFLVEGR